MTISNHDHPISRREFLKKASITGGALLVLPLIASCAIQIIPEPGTLFPASAKEMPIMTNRGNQKVKVALVRTKDRNAGVLKALGLLGVNPFRGKPVILKPNFNTADPFPASTHNDTLSTLITTIKDMGASKVTIGERSGPATSREVMEKKGIFTLSKNLGFGVINLDDLDSDGWIHRQPEGSHWKDGFLFARPYYEAESIVSTCCLKTHMYGGHFTMSLKLSVGMVHRSNMGELHSSPHQRKMIAEINTSYKPDLIVMDGLSAFVDRGPMSGTIRQAGFILAGNDRIAIDATGVAILRVLGTTREVSCGAVFEQDQIKRAVELGLGVSSPKEIEYLTGDAESKELADQIVKTMLVVSPSSR